MVILVCKAHAVEKVESIHTYPLSIMHPFLATHKAHCSIREPYARMLTQLCNFQTGKVSKDISIYEGIYIHARLRFYDTLISKRSSRLPVLQLLIIYKEVECMWYLLLVVMNILILFERLLAINDKNVVVSSMFLSKHWLIKLITFILMHCETSDCYFQRK